MEKPADTGGVTRMVERRLSQLKVAARLLAHEIEVASGEKGVTLDSDLAQSLLATLELFIEDAEGAKKAAAGPVMREPEKKGTVTRLN